MIDLQKKQLYRHHKGNISLGLRGESSLSLYFLLTDLSVGSLKRSASAACL